MSRSSILAIDGTCPYCGANAGLRVQHKWGEPSDIPQKIGDRVDWRGRPHPPSQLVLGVLALCSACSVNHLSGAFRQVWIEVRDDVIKAAFHSANIAKAVDYFNEVATSNDFRVWDNTDRTKVESIAHLVMLQPELLAKYYEWLSNKEFPHRQSVFDAIKLMVAEIVERGMVRGKIGSEANLGPLFYGPAVERIGLDKLRAALDRIGAGDPLLEASRKLMKEFPEKVYK